MHSFFSWKFLWLLTSLLLLKSFSFVSSPLTCKVLKIKQKQALVMQSGLREVADKYDAFLVDAWGVLHDGSKPYAGAIDCLERLGSDKKIVLLSNSSKRKDDVIKGLRKLGFDTNVFQDIVTSGDVAWNALKERTEEPFASLGNTCLVLGNGDDDTEYVTSAGCTFASADTYDFVLARGVFTLIGDNGARVAGGREEKHVTVLSEPKVKEALDTAKRRGVPMLVTNPDWLRPGTNDPMPGLVGKEYAADGGQVHWVGKPHPLVYERCRTALGADATSRICAVGDSLGHDICGAISAGISSVYIISGVHSAELGIEQGGDERPTDKALHDLYEKYLPTNTTPTHTVTSFKW